jgi:peptidoglycan/LPS O-acetylase OafA/YrhL
MAASTARAFQSGGAIGPGIPPVLASNLQQKKIPKLDALRAASALIVVLYHYGLPLPAGVGVLVFFVISGFLITWLLLGEWSRTGRVSLPHFYFRRTFRIFPAFYVYWAVVVGGLLWKHGRILWGQAAATLFYVGNYYQGLRGYPESGLSHAWSLGVEEQYYLLWPAVFLLLARNPRRLFGFTCGGVSLVWILRGVLQAAGVPESYLYTAFETRADHLLAGCLLAISLRYGYAARFWRAVCAKPWYALAPPAGLAISAALEMRLGVGYRNSVGFIVDPLLVVVLIAQLLALPPGTLRWADSRPVVYLGTISYSTYLYHKIAGGVASHFMARLGVTGIASLVFAVAAAWAAASVSYFLVERPFLRMRDRIERRWLPARPAYVAATNAP